MSPYYPQFFQESSPHCSLKDGFHQRFFKSIFGILYIIIIQPFGCYIHPRISLRFGNLGVDLFWIYGEMPLLIPSQGTSTLDLQQIILRNFLVIRPGQHNILPVGQNSTDPSCGCSPVLLGSRCMVRGYSFKFTFTVSSSKQQFLVAEGRKTSESSGIMLLFSQMLKLSSSFLLAQSLAIVTNRVSGFSFISIRVPRVGRRGPANWCFWFGCETVTLLTSRFTCSSQQSYSQVIFSVVLVSLQWLPLLSWSDS